MINTFILLLLSAIATDAAPVFEAQNAEGASVVGSLIELTPQRAVLETSLGRCEILVVVDSSVPPGVVQVAAAPEAIDICGAFARCRVAFL